MYFGLSINTPGLISPPPQVQFLKILENHMHIHYNKSKQPESRVTHFRSTVHFTNKPSDHWDTEIN